MKNATENTEPVWDIEVSPLADLIYSLYGALQRIAEAEGEDLPDLMQDDVLYRAHKYHIYGSEMYKAAEKYGSEKLKAAEVALDEATTLTEVKTAMEMKGFTDLPSMLHDVYIAAFDVDDDELTFPYFGFGLRDPETGDLLIASLPFGKIFSREGISRIVTRGYNATGLKFWIEFVGSRGYLCLVRFHCEMLEKYRYGDVSVDTSADQIVTIYHSEANGIRVEIADPS